MNFLLATLGLFLAIQSCEGQVFRTSKIYQSNMVLQASPKRSRIWGFGEIGSTVSINMGNYFDTMSIGGNAQWAFTLPPQEAGGPYDISIEQNALNKGTKAVKILENVIFGDVWLCAGEGNMQFPMRNVFNSTYEMETALNYKDKIRIAQMAPDTWDTELDEPRLDYDQPWSELQADIIPQFSALCLLYAERLLDQVPDHPPIGLIQATYEDSNIEAWVSRRVFDVCNSTQSSEVGQGPVKDHALWNAMINPLTKTSIRGSLWYQGESNVEYNDGWYVCHFRNLTFDWADTFFDGTIETHVDGWSFPFGFVQLGPMEDSSDNRVSILRQHQTFDTEFAPNQENNETFMAAAYDLYDGSSPYGSVYYRDKQTVAKRLAHSLVFLMYDRFDLEFVGPIPSIEVKNLTFYTITYSWDVQINGQAGDPSGFSFRHRNGVWTPAPIYNITEDTMTFVVDEGVVEVAYGWSAKTCDYKSCPVYSSDRGPDGLPAVLMSFPLYVWP